MIAELSCPHDACQCAHGGEESAQVGANHRGIQGGCCGGGTGREFRDNGMVQDTHGNVVDQVRCQKGGAAEAGERARYGAGTCQKTAKGSRHAVLIKGKHQDEHGKHKGNQIPRRPNKAPPNEVGRPMAEEADSHGEQDQTAKETAGNQPHGQVKNGRNRQQQDAPAQVA